MTLYQFLNEESEGSRERIVIAALLSGLANTTVLVLVAVGKQTAGTLHSSLWLLYVLACLLYVFSFSYCVKSITNITEDALQKVRLRLAEKLRRVELIVLDQIGPGRVYDQITQQTMVISNNSWLIILGLQSLTAVLFILLYILYLSKTTFIVMLILLAIAVPLYRRRDKVAGGYIAEAANHRLRLFDTLNDFLRGFKEVRLREHRGEDLQTEFDEAAATVRDATIRAQVLEQENMAFISFNFYILLAVTVFVLPQLAATGARALNDVTAAVLFILGPLGILSFSLPQYERATLAAESLRALEQRLDRAAAPTPAGSASPFAGGFRRIVLRDLAFSYTDPAGGSSFSLGPVSLSIDAGEIVFFVGGNGSGKTTLLKALAGLYIPQAGSVAVDGIVINDDYRQHFRENIAAIFTDFHLFKKLYGLSHHRADEVNSLLHKMLLDQKTAYGDSGFSRIDLSTGQKKRIAMVVALLEDRPLYIFDEWAADQDPEFRRYYYEELLPELKRKGKTVLAISHDDRYFHCADRVVTMDYGTVRSIERMTEGAQRRL